MPDDLRRAHDDNDEVLERIYIGRRFRNDTERLEKLFDLYTKMTADAPPKSQDHQEGQASRMTVTEPRAIPGLSLRTAHTGASSKPNELGMREMQRDAYAHRGEQYLLIKSPPASGKSRALMFIALDKLHNQGVAQAIVVVPERSIGGSFADEPLTKHGFYWDWTVKPHWNLCNVPGADDVKVAKSKVKAVAEFLASGDPVLVCTHATFRFALAELGVEAFDGRLIAVDEFHHVSADPENRLGTLLGQLIARDQVHLIAMTGSYFRGDAVAVLAPEDEAKFVPVTYTYYQQLNGYEHLKTLNIAYSFYTGRYIDKINDLLDPAVKTIVHIPSVNSRESTKDKHREVEEIMDHLGTWRGTDEATGFHQIETAAGNTIKVADLVDDDPAKRDRVSSALKAAGGAQLTATMSISSSRSAWRRRASTGSGANMR